MGRLKLTLPPNEEVTRRSLKVVGPMGWLADKGGRPTTPLGPPTFSFFGWAAPGVHLSMVEIWPVVMLNFFSNGPFNPCEACVTVFARSTSCSLAEKGMIALHFWLKPALIEI